MLRVELLGHGGDAAARDGLLAAGAQRAAPLVVVHLAVGLPVVLEEAAVDEGREAFLRGGRGSGGKGAQPRAGGWAAPRAMGRRRPWPSPSHLGRVPYMPSAALNAA